MALRERIEVRFRAEGNAESATLGARHLPSGFRLYQISVEVTSDNAAR
jgi:hypothetical protein